MTTPEETLPPQRLRVMQIIAMALILGVSSFLGIVLYLVSQNNGQGMAPNALVPLMSLLAGLFLVIAAVLASIIAAAQTRSMLRQIASGSWRPPPRTNPNDYHSDAAKLLAVRQTTLIVKLALFEGAALFGCLAYMLQGQPFVLAVILAALGLMLVNFPTERRVRTWLEQQADRLAALRQEKGFAAER
jgi:membrane protein YdbS with pleckstrin-like domain